MAFTTPCPKRDLGTFHPSPFYTSPSLSSERANIIAMLDLLSVSCFNLWATSCVRTTALDSVIVYIITRLSSWEGWYPKIHQSDRAIAGLIFSKYQTGSVRIRPEIELFKMADAEEIEVRKLSPRNTKQFLSRRRKTPLWAWFGMWNNLERPEEARWTWKREVITNGSSWASRFYRRT